MGRLNKNLGKHAVVQVACKNIRPKEKMRELFPNDYKQRKELFVVFDFLPDHKIDGKEADCLKLKMKSDFQVECYCRATLIRLVEKGPPNQLFRNDPPPPPPPVPVPPTQLGEEEHVPQLADESDNDGLTDDEALSREPQQQELTSPEPVIWEDFIAEIPMDARGSFGQHIQKVMILCKVYSKHR